MHKYYKAQELRYHVLHIFSIFDNEDLVTIIAFAIALSINGLEKSELSSIIT